MAAAAICALPERGCPHAFLRFNALYTTRLMHILMQLLLPVCDVMLRLRTM